MNSVRETLVPVRAPFRLDLTANVLRRLSSNVVDQYAEGRYERAFPGPNGVVIFTAELADAETLRVELGGADADRYDAQALAQRLLGTDVDLSGFSAAAAAIPWLAALAAGARGVKPPRYPTLWEACVNAIVYQQVSIHAAAAILRRVIERYMTPVGTHRLHPFPPPDIIVEADPEELRGLGLSINKVVSLRHVARAVLDGALDEATLDTLTTSELTAALAIHRGIGPWTAAVIALRGFGRLDTFPMNDSGVAKSVREVAQGIEIDVDAVLEALGAQRGMLYYHLLLARLAARGDVVLGTPAAR